MSRKDEKIYNSSFSVLAAEWLKYIRPKLRDSSYIKYRNLVQSYLIPQYQKQMVDSITEDDIRNNCRILLTEGGVRQDGLSRKTVADTLSVLRSILQYAKSQGIDTLCTGKEVQIGRRPGELNILQKDEQERLCRYLTEYPSRRNLGIFLCLFTGLRIGEICALKWSDISFTKKTIHIHQSMQRIQIDGNSEENVQGKKTAVMLGTPKSCCSIRTIPLPGNVQRFMELNFPDRTGYILTGDENKYVEPRNLQRYFRRVLEKAEISPVNFHSLRHTFATRCIEVGFDVKSLSEILGHSSVSITMNRYVHPTMEMKAENMQKLSALFVVR